MTPCRPRRCPECGDLLIHQERRGEHESSSAFGQHVHDEYGGRGQRRTFDFSDIDGVVYKRSEGILRIIEGKPSKGEPSSAQRRIMPLLADGVKWLMDQGRISRQSGVYVVRANPPYDVASV